MNGCLKAFIELATKGSFLFSFCENCAELLERVLILLTLIMIVVQCTAVVYLLEWSVGEGVDFKLNQQQGALEFLSWCTPCCVAGP